LKPFRYHAVLMLRDTFGFLDKVLIKLRSHFGRSFEHNIRLALAGEVAKVKSFSSHLNFGADRWASARDEGWSCERFY
jgi:hypothetical protein